MILSVLAVVIGLAIIVWSADRFIEGAAESAFHLSVPPILIGVVIVGFGTSAPEMVVSVLASVEGNTGIAIGNAYGSNITNIGLIVGVTALAVPITVYSRFVRREMPLLVAVTGLAVVLLLDEELSRFDAVVLLSAFFVVMGWSVWQGMQSVEDPFGAEVREEVEQRVMPLRRSLIWLVVGLVLLIGSSRLLVWGAVDIAGELGVSDLIIGLTVVAIGTSLPELASCLIAVRKDEHDLALGNIVGSNLFNTLVVIGLASAIDPTAVAPEVLNRDIVVMCALTVALFVVGFSFRGAGRINRWEGGALVAAFVGYTSYLVVSVV